MSGGALKTVAEADSESLQAKWIDDLNELSLRAVDIIPIVERARLYHDRGDSPWHSNLLPAQKSYSKLLLRIVLVIRKKSK